MTKRIIILILIAAVSGLSYFNSEKIYGFYMAAYYKALMKESPGDAAGRIKNAAQTGDAGELKTAVQRANAAYPGNALVLTAGGIAFIDAGLISEGLSLIGPLALAGELDRLAMSKLVNALYVRGYYDDVVSIASSGSNLNYSEVRRYHALSLFKLSEYSKAAIVFRRLLEYEGPEADVLYHLGTSLSRSGNPRKAVPYLERAYRMDRESRHIRAELVKAYGAAGMFKEASGLMMDPGLRRR